MSNQSLEYRIETLEAFLDFDPTAPADDSLPATIYELVQDVLEQRLEGNAHGALGDAWDADYCRVCGVDNQSTHAPWCEYRDGTPVADIDRWRLFGDWVNARLTALETKAPC